MGSGTPHSVHGQGLGGVFHLFLLLTLLLLFFLAHLLKQPFFLLLFQEFGSRIGF
jgi:hypothetical protein